MHSKTEEFKVELELRDIQEQHPKSFQLYEEYSQTPIINTVEIRMKRFNEADIEAKSEMLATVEKEIEQFRTWLEEKKHFDHTTAYYYSTGLKSLLLGLPIGVQIAWLFETIMDSQGEK